MIGTHVYPRWIHENLGVRAPTAARSPARATTGRAVHNDCVADGLDSGVASLRLQSTQSTAAEATRAT